MGNRHWTKAHFINKASLDDKIYETDEAEARKDIDVLFIGENIVEAWAGRWLGVNNTDTSEVKDSFDKHFNKAKGGKYDGLALGIAGDTVSYSSYANIFRFFLPDISIDKNYRHLMFCGESKTENFQRNLILKLFGLLLVPMTLP